MLALGIDRDLRKQPSGRCRFPRVRGDRPAGELRQRAGVDGAAADSHPTAEPERWAASRSATVRLRDRSRIVLAAAAGLTNKEIAAELGLDVLSNEK